MWDVIMCMLMLCVRFSFELKIDWYFFYWVLCSLKSMIFMTWVQIWCWMVKKIKKNLFFFSLIRNANCVFQKQKISTMKTMISIKETRKGKWKKKQICSNFKCQYWKHKTMEFVGANFVVVKVKWYEKCSYYWLQVVSHFYHLLEKRCRFFGLFIHFSLTTFGDFLCSSHFLIWFSEFLLFVLLFLVSAKNVKKIVKRKLKEQKITKAGHLVICSHEING